MLYEVITVENELEPEPRDPSPETRSPDPGLRTPDSGALDLGRQFFAGRRDGKDVQIMLMLRIDLLESNQPPADTARRP